MGKTVLTAALTEEKWDPPNYMNGKLPTGRGEGDLICQKFKTYCFKRSRVPKLSSKDSCLGRIWNSELESCLNEVPWFLQRSFYLSCSPGFKGASWKSHPYTGLRTDGPHPPRKILFLILAAPHFLILRYTMFPKDASLPCGHTTCLFRHGRRPNHHRPRELVTSFRFSYREALGSA